MFSRRLLAVSFLGRSFFFLGSGACGFFGTVIFLTMCSYWWLTSVQPAERIAAGSSNEPDGTRLGPKRNPSIPLTQSFQICNSGTVSKEIAGGHDDAVTTTGGLG